MTETAIKIEDLYFAYGHKPILLGVNLKVPNRVALRISRPLRCRQDHHHQAFTGLSIKAVKSRWHWQPGQKSLAWTIGMTAVFIFGVSMLQISNNLQAVSPDTGLESPINLAESPIGSDNMRDWTEVVELPLKTPERFNGYNLSAPGRSLYLLADNLVIMAVMERSQTADPHGGYTHVGYIKLPDIRERDRTAAKSLIRFPVTELTENNNPPKILGGFVKDE